MLDSTGTSGMYGSSTASTKVKRAARYLNHFGWCRHQRETLSVRPPRRSRAMNVIVAMASRPCSAELLAEQAGGTEQEHGDQHDEGNRVAPLGAEDRRPVVLDHAQQQAAHQCAA